VPFRQGDWHRSTAPQRGEHLLLVGEVRDSEADVGQERAHQNREILASTPLVGAVCASADCRRHPWKDEELFAMPRRRISATASCHPFADRDGEGGQQRSVISPILTPWPWRSSSCGHYDRKDLLKENSPSHPNIPVEQINEKRLALTSETVSRRTAGAAAGVVTATATMICIARGHRIDFHGTSKWTAQEGRASLLTQGCESGAARTALRRRDQPPRPLSNTTRGVPIWDCKSLTPLLQLAV